MYFYVYGYIIPNTSISDLSTLNRTLDEAAELAFQQKSEEDLNLVLRQCAGNRQLSAKINTMKQQLGKK